MEKTVLLSFILFLINPLYAGDIPPPVAEWWFWPDYQLPRNASAPSAANLGFHPKASEVPERSLPPVLLGGELPTERLPNLLSGDLFSQSAFSIEFWLLDHVNQPVGTMAVMRPRGYNQGPNWTLSYFDRRVQFAAGGGEDWKIETTVGEDRDWRRFLHIVAVYDGSELSIYVNGVREGVVPVDDHILVTEDAQFELAGYFGHEDYMELSNLLKLCRIYNIGLTQSEIADNFRSLQDMAKKGFLRKLFHYNVRPYLSFATRKSVSLTWETNDPARAVVEYGTKLPLTEKRAVDEFSRIHQYTLNGLEASTTYFYRIKAQNAKGAEVESHLLTFSTAVNQDEAVSFAVFGDTEARPHINNRISQLVWEERPHFVINLGDMTDGGSKTKKYEWNYEYFPGMNALHGRIPVFPVPGNGDGDLYWFNRYHGVPGDAGYYTFRFGNAEFFMINSVPKEELRPGGEQYVWLENKLRESTADWKIACHHYAPYSSDEDDYGDSWTGSTTWGDLEVRELVTLYDRYDVDMVFYGHLHAYERSHPLAASQLDPENGVVYVLSGGAGGNLEDFAPTRSRFAAKTYRGHHYCTVNIYRNRLDFRMYDLRGSLRDFLEIQK
jgi:hypothetical protein